MKKWFVYSLLIPLLLFACNSQDSANIEENPNSVAPNVAWDNAVIEVAKDVSIKMNNLAFRKMLKHEVMLQFDGDYNILIRSMVHRMPKYLAYEESETYQYKSSSARNEEDLLKNLDFDLYTEIAAQYPQMQIAVQVNADLWNPDTEVLSVVFVPADYDEQTHTYVDGFDSEGRPIRVSTLVDPIENYVVISMNERTYIREDGTMIASAGSPNELIVVPCFEEHVPFDLQNITDMIRPIDPCLEDRNRGEEEEDDEEDNENYEDYIGVGHTGTIPSLLGTYPADIVSIDTIDYSPSNLDPVGAFLGRPIYRKNYEYERIRQFRCEKPKEIEHWTAGKLELRISKFSSVPGAPTYVNEILVGDYGKIDRHDMNNEWYTPRPLGSTHLWRFDETGTTIGYYWFEHDDGLNPHVINLSNSLSNEIVTTDTIGNVIVTTTLSTNLGVTLQNDSDDEIGFEEISTFNDNDVFSEQPGDFYYKSWADD